jgi:N4-gp56 family major capsid protein
MKDTIKELAQTQSSDVRGTAITGYGLQPILFLKDVVDAAKTQLYFANFVGSQQAPDGTKDVIVPKRKLYEGQTGVSDNTSELVTANTDMTFTTLDNLDSVTVTPTTHLSGYALTKYALRTNAVNLANAAKEELSYAIGDRLDQAIATALGDATSAAATAAGAQVLYGGDATSDATLTAGDIITTDLVAKAKRYLGDKYFYYRATGSAGAGTGTGAETKVTSTYFKNPWPNSKDDPYTLFIGLSQEEAFLKDSQFVNSAEYGNDTVVQNGEIGMYLGVRIVSTPNIESVASGGTAISGGSAAGTDVTRCILCKPKKACTVVWGRKPEVKTWENNDQDQVRISLVCEYAIGIIQPDAIVWIDVADA